MRSMARLERLTPDLGSYPDLVVVYTATARGRMFSSRQRAGQEGDAPAPVVAEAEIYGAQTVSADG
jgi:hypothetical protein